MTFDELFAGMNNTPVKSEPKKFREVEPGHAYQVYITNAEKSVSSKGLNGIKIKGDITDFTGNKYGSFNQWFYLDMDSLDYVGNRVFFALCQALGIPQEVLEDMDAFAALLVHQECLGVFTIDKKDDGRKFPRIDIFNPGMFGNINDMQDYDRIFNGNTGVKMSEIPDVPDGNGADEVDFF